MGSNGIKRVEIDLRDTARTNCTLSVLPTTMFASEHFSEKKNETFCEQGVKTHIAIRSLIATFGVLQECKILHITYANNILTPTKCAHQPSTSTGYLKCNLNGSIKCCVKKFRSYGSNWHAQRRALRAPVWEKTVSTETVELAWNVYSLFASQILKSLQQTFFSCFSPRPPYHFLWCGRVNSFIYILLYICRYCDTLPEQIFISFRCF